MITETRERFLRTIAERIDPARIVEVHFFPSIRQGPMETGVAVIAATPTPEPVAADEPAPELPFEPLVPGDPTAPRTEVFTAAYRWTRKGPERGKWAVDVTTEAHAPLTTVETVVRGVQERAGEALDAHRMGGDEVRQLLGVGTAGTASAADTAGATG